MMFLIVFFKLRLKLYPIKTILTAFKSRNVLSSFPSGLYIASTLLTLQTSVSQTVGRFNELFYDL